ncbi:MAG: right-handed parallel beta-helix repeat-containing protein [Proteobacteria bacterium]|nr:right-handed parallel beta-helix repeat-containing protein [Pseudomonadota bacterium]
MLSAAVEFRRTRSCAIRRCTIQHTGAHGIIVGIGSHDNLLESSVLQDLGAGGVWIGHPSHLVEETEVPRDNTVRDNLISTGGRMHPAGVGVLVTNASHTTVEHNDIRDFYYSGISVGWNWGYTPSNAHHNSIAYNHAHQLGQQVLSDLAGIYTLGISPGTRLHHNLLHQITRSDYGAFGIYFDQASSGIVADSNVVYATQDAPFIIHYGEDNTLLNNVLVAEGPAPLRRGKAEARHALTVERNVLVSTGAAVQQGSWADGNYTFDRNLYWTYGSSPLDFGGRSFAQWQAEGADLHSLVADPAFVDFAAREFSFSPESPAALLGIRQVDLSRSGRLSRPRSTDLPEAPAAFPAAITVAPLHVDFEDMLAGAVPTRGISDAGAGSGSLRVSDKAGAMGTKQSLLFQDAADIEQSYKPYYQLRTDHGAGTYRLTFALLRQAGSTARIELRDWRTDPYTIGPVLTIRSDGTLVVAGRSLASVPTDRWVSYEITAPLGAAADGTFELVVQPEDGERQVFGQLRCGAATFSHLTWIGFLSLATTPATFFLDEIYGQSLP